MNALLAAVLVFAQFFGFYETATAQSAPARLEGNVVCSCDDSGVVTVTATIWGTRQATGGMFFLGVYVKDGDGVDIKTDTVIGGKQVLTATVTSIETIVWTTRVTKGPIFRERTFFKKSGSIRCT